MKSGIHPTYFPKAKITCSCGAVLITGSTLETYTTELCSKCHPFYTGKRKTVDTAGRIEMFTMRRKLADQKKSAVSKKEEKKRRTIEDKVNEALQRDRDHEMVKEQELMTRIRKNRPVPTEIPVVEAPKPEAKKEVVEPMTGEAEPVAKTPNRPVAKRRVSPSTKTTRASKTTKVKTTKKAITKKK